MLFEGLINFLPIEFIPGNPAFNFFCTIPIIFAIASVILGMFLRVTSRS